MKYLKMKLVYTQQTEQDVIFDRYEIGDYQVWFEQYQDNGKDNRRQNCVGCIFQVSIMPLNIEDNLPKLNIYRGIGDDKGWPKVYEYEQKYWRLQLEDMDRHIKRVKYAKLVLASVKHYLENSFHYELFKERAKLKEN